LRRQQILKFRAAGLFPPVSAHERERWERDYGADVRAFTREHPLDINGPPPNERILTDWAEWRQLRAKAQQLSADIDAQVEGATQQMSPVIDAPPTESVEPIWPPNSDKACPWCHRQFGYAMHLSRHMKGCPERPRTAA
jgi:hypothetical protein